ncbi:MAG TPA: hypothetical protein VF754_08785, partial [Pyrinomonadaceae bacterium]
MTQNLGETINWLKHNLDLQLEDIELEEQQKQIQLYFDTADLHVAVIGSYAYYDDDGEFNAEKFEEQRTLVRCLAASGWLGGIRLLPPHQAEFLNQMRIHFGIGFETDPKGQANKFLKDALGLDKSLVEMTDDERREFVESLKGRAQESFKTTQCVLPWHRRLATWLREETLVLDSTKTPYYEIVTSSNFETLKKAFDERRQHTPVNNFADAIA